MENNKQIISLDTDALTGVEASKAKAIKQVFEPMVKMLEGFEAAYNSIVNDAKENGIDDAIIKRAKTTRLAIAKIRTMTESSRKEQKAQYLAAGKAIDGVANILKFAVQDKEENLKKIETYFARMEAERIAKIKAEREEILEPFVEDVTVYDLGNMANDVFEIFIEKKKKEHAEKLEQEEKERKAEALRLEKLAKLEAIEKENARLKAELEAKAKQAPDVVQDERPIKTVIEKGLSDTQKLASLINDLKALQEKYTFETDKGKNVWVNINGLITKLIGYVQKYAKDES